MEKPSEICLVPVPTNLLSEVYAFLASRMGKTEKDVGGSIPLTKVGKNKKSGKRSKGARSRRASKRKEGGAKVEKTAPGLSGKALALPRSADTERLNKPPEPVGQLVRANITPVSRAGNTFVCDVDVPRTTLGTKPVKSVEGTSKPSPIVVKAGPRAAAKKAAEDAATAVQDAENHKRLSSIPGDLKRKVMLAKYINREHPGNMNEFYIKACLRGDFDNYFANLGLLDTSSNKP